MKITKRMAKVIVIHNLLEQGYVVELRPVENPTSFKLACKHGRIRVFIFPEDSNELAVHRFDLMTTQRLDSVAAFIKGEEVRYLRPVKLPAATADCDEEHEVTIGWGRILEEGHVTLRCLFEGY